MYTTMPQHLGGLRKTGRRLMNKASKRINKRIMKSRKTSTDNEHNHTWTIDRKFTSSDKGSTGISHKHRIDLLKGIAKESQGHTHKLL